MEFVKVEDDYVLSANDLVEHHKTQTTLPYRGPKEQHPDGSQLQANKVQVRRDQRHALIKTQRVSKLGALSFGEWEPDKELVVVKSHKGKFWNTMGYMLQGQKYLYPEEGLFLLEVGSMELQYGGVPLSIQRAYSLMIPTYISKEHYRVYCQFMRLGYITTRHKESDITDYEYRLRMHQYRHTQNLAYHKVQGWFQQLGDEPMNSIWPDSDSNAGSIDLLSSSNGQNRSRTPGNYNSNSNTGWDSSEVGSAGEMSRRVIKARQKVHQSGTKSARAEYAARHRSGGDRVQQLKFKSESGKDEEEQSESAKFQSEKESAVEGIGEKTNEGSKKASKDEKPGGIGNPGTKSEKLCDDFAEPLEPSDNSEKSAKLGRDVSDDSSVYSDGPVYQDDLDGSKGNVTDEASISIGLLDFHKRKLNGSSEEGSRKHHKKPKIGSSESSSNRVKKPKFPSPMDVPYSFAPSKGNKKTSTLEDSGKDTHSDPDQDSLRHGHQQELRSVKKRIKQGLKQSKHEWSMSSDLGLSDTASSNSVDLEEFLDMVMPMLQGAPKGPNINDQDIQTYLDYPHWNFEKISLPDIASNVKPAHLPFPSRELVPASIAASRCINEMANVEEKQLQLTQLSKNNKMLLAKSKKIIDVLELIGDSKNKNRDSKTPSPDNSKEPDNWKQYKEKKQQEEQNMTELMTSPVSHLWSGVVKPLLKPADAKSTGHVMNKLRVIHSANLTCEHTAQSLCPPLLDPKIAFDVFLPDKKYKKTNPGQPNLSVVVCSEEDPVPELAAQVDLLLKAAPAPLVWAIVDNADINFYTLNDIELPVDVTIG